VDAAISRWPAGYAIAALAFVGACA